MTDINQDKIKEIKAWFAYSDKKLPLTIFSKQCQEHVNWLVHEVERLRKEQYDLIGKIACQKDKAKSLTKQRKKNE